MPDDRPFDGEAWLEMSRGRLKLVQASSGKSFLPESDLPVTQHLPCLLLNLLTENGEDVRVLDFAGGTGIIYFLIYPYLSRPDRVEWNVVDAPQLRELGETRVGSGHRIRFHEELPGPDESFDVVHINTALQYVSDYVGLLERLLAHAPRYVVLTRLLAGDVDPYYTLQQLKGLWTPCAIASAPEITGLMQRHGYQLLFRAPATEEPLPDARWDSSVPADRRIASSIHVVFGRVRG